MSDISKNVRELIGLVQRDLPSDLRRDSIDERNARELCEWSRRLIEEHGSFRAQRDALLAAAKKLRTAHAAAARAPVNSHGVEARRKESEAWLELFAAIAQAEAGEKGGGGS